MPCGQLGVLARVSRVHGLSDLDPFSLALDDMAVGTLSIGRDGGRSRAASDAAGSNAGVAGRGSEDVRVGGHHYVGHHAPGAGACDKDLAGVGAVLLDCPFDHGNEALVVSAGITGKALLGVDFPAVGVAFGGGIDCDESFLLGKPAVLCLLVVGFAAAVAGVQLW